MIDVHCTRLGRSGVGRLVSFSRHGRRILVNGGIRGIKGGIYMHIFIYIYVYIYIYLVMVIEDLWQHALFLTLSLCFYRSLPSAALEINPHHLPSHLIILPLQSPGGSKQDLPPRPALREFHRRNTLQRHILGPIDDSLLRPLLSPCGLSNLDDPPPLPGNVGALAGVVEIEIVKRVDPPGVLNLGQHLDLAARGDVPLVGEFDPPEIPLAGNGKVEVSVKQGPDGEAVDAEREDCAAEELGGLEDCGDGVGCCVDSEDGAGEGVGREDDAFVGREGEEAVGEGVVEGDGVQEGGGGGVGGEGEDVEGGCGGVETEAGHDAACDGVCGGGEGG